ncbi:MAG TPA: hypothetical protein VL337_09685 [Acidimicrobiales bacterium]|nr:hypothetical protein [Acidimicrobiales bacterium]
MTRTEAALRLGIGAGVALAAWLLLLAVLAAASRPRRPDPAPASMELGGEEPPAVVAMLADQWAVPKAAVPATLLDLAARKVVAIDQVSPERFVVRLPARSPESVPLSDYEEQVLRHVRGLAAGDGTVACEALTTGPEEQSANWWKSFDKAVRADARRRGLSRSRWSKWMTGLLAVTAAVPALLAAGAIVVTPNDKSSTKTDDNPIGAFIGLAFLFEGGLMAIPGAMRAERDTPAGHDAAGRWLGLRDYLHEDPAFSDAPPAAVAVWDRYLAYGAALGVAAGAVRALPLGAESDRVAWSAFGGRWRTVKIRYPKRIPPGWGRHPALATAIGLAGVAAGLFAARIFFPVLTDLASRLGDSAKGDGFQPVDLLGIALVGIPVAVTALWLVRSAAMLAAAVPDLAGRREVEGVALRVRRREEDTYLAVDDGDGAEIRAWRVEGAVLNQAGVTQGAHVRATVSPRLGHVFELHRINSADPSP